MSYLVKAEWVVEDRERAYRLSEALAFMGATACTETIPKIPDGYRPGCPREGCPCHVPGPVCEECMCIRPESGPYCPRCGWHHDRHIAPGGPDEGWRSPKEARMRPEVWLHEGQLIIKHRYGGCYDVVELDNVGVSFVGEISTVPEDAVRLVEKAREDPIMCCETGTADCPDPACPASAFIGRRPG